ncbi:hypothetical protein NMG60_11007667 [Bertholletia excelsa]
MKIKFRQSIDTSDVVLNLCSPLNHRHRHAPLHRTLKTRPIRLTQDPLHLLRQPKEPELRFQVGKAIVGWNLVIVNPIVLLRYRNHCHPHLGHPRRRHHHSVGPGGSLL